MHPAGYVAVTEYVVVVAGDTWIELDVEPVLHCQPNGGTPDAVSFNVSPGQING